MEKMLQQELALSRGDSCELSMLSLFHRWISGFLGFSHEDFLGEECVSCAADRYPCENCPRWLDFPLQEVDSWSELVGFVVLGVNEDRAACQQVMKLEEQV